MSSGSYNYLSCTADESALELLESRGDVAQMLQRLPQLEYATQAAQATESILRELGKLSQVIAESEQKIKESERRIKLTNESAVW
ncbi:MAG: hypothetical protein N4J56_007772 [Chroococcidiopsis sp. SAG 2025]|uniref:hypothetical protein n=1 Tax=Chroococcidiopsis sp. SAG 2025 TaxID=171389 RepID=UPI002936E5F1|nr:hypothetical protein [Chroococcidiopsis sp. SAG 2025]MDV2998067.1 hypothetical protein [Chroococcidiopsis sp. SAG 2025]